MFKVSTIAKRNMYNIIAYIVLMALWSNLVCIAQDPFLNAVNLKSLTDSLSYPKMQEAILDRNSNKPPCLSWPTGCTEEELVQIESAECAKLRSSPNLDRLVCTPYHSQQTDSISIYPKAAPQKEELGPSMAGSDLDETSASLDPRPLYGNEQQTERPLNQQQQYDVNSFNNLMDKLERIENKPIKGLLDELMNARSQEAAIANNDYRKTTMELPPVLDSASDTRGSFRHKLPSQIWQATGPKPQDYGYSKRKYGWQDEVQNLPDHQITITADEARQIIDEQLYPLLKESTLRKMPIIRLKFGINRNLHSTLSSSAEPKRVGESNRKWSSIKMYPPPHYHSTVRYQRSGMSSNLTASNSNQIKMAEELSKIDLDGGLSGNRSPTAGNMLEQELVEQLAKGSLDQESSILECSMRRYTFKATKFDEVSGNKCSGLVTASICYGGCESGEIADWLFPHKKAIHKVCNHGSRIKRKVILNNCSPKADSQLREYFYVDAESCVCKKCTSLDTSCLGGLTKPYLGASADVESGTEIQDSTSKLID